MKYQINRVSDAGLSRRQGYAMLLVLAFLVFMFSLLGLAYRPLGSLLRAETLRVHQVTRDEGSIRALAKGLALLETGYPSTNPYVCGTSIVTSSGTRAFTVTFAELGGNHWSVRAAPTADGENPQAMPTAFSSTTPP
jgi:hypothetical protein